MAWIAWLTSLASVHFLMDCMDIMADITGNPKELEFDFETRTVTMRSIGEDPRSDPLLMASMSMDKLSGRGALAGSRLISNDFETVAAMHNSSLPEREWICINYRGYDSQILHILGHATTTVLLAILASMPLLMSVLLWRVFKRRHLQERSVFVPSCTSNKCMRL